MSTTVQQILTAALNRSLANDAGSTDLGSSSQEMVGVISRMVREVYALAALPNQDGGWQGRGDYFTRTQTVTLGTPATTFVALPTAPEYARVTSVTDAGGRVVGVATVRDLRDGIAEYAPAVLIADQKIRSLGRAGDPTAGAVLTLDGSYLPAELTALTDTIGATTPSVPSTSAWPSQVGDSYLIAQLARYLIIKDGLRDGAELQAVEADVQRSSELLAATIGVSAARVAAVRAA